MNTSYTHGTTIGGNMWHRIGRQRGERHATSLCGRIISGLVTLSGAGTWRLEECRSCKTAYAKRGHEEELPPPIEPDGENVLRVSVKGGHYVATETRDGRTLRFRYVSSGEALPREDWRTKHPMRAPLLPAGHVLRVYPGPIFKIEKEES